MLFCGNTYLGAFIWDDALFLILVGGIELVEFSVGNNTTCRDIHGHKCVQNRSIHVRTHDEDSMCIGQFQT